MSDLRKVQFVPQGLQKSDLDTFITELKEQYQNISLETMVNICIDVMQKVQKFTKLRGSEKKEVVVYAIYRLIEDVDSEMYKQYELIIEKCITTMIDIVIDIDKHKVKIKQGIGIVTKLFKACGICK